MTIRVVLQRLHRAIFNSPIQKGPVGSMTAPNDGPLTPPKKGKITPIQRKRAAAKRKRT